MASPSVARRITQASAIVMASVLLSRILGFLREWTVAHQIGSNAVTDAYYAAFTLPDFLNHLVTGGSLSLTFIPVFAKYLAEGHEDEGWHVFSIVLSFLSFVLIALVFVAELFAPVLVSLVAPGFEPDQKARVVFLTRLMLPAQICFCVGSILSAVQYAKGQFLIPSLAPLIYNLGVIAGGLLLSPYIGITGFAVGVLAGAIIGNLLLQVYGARRAQARFSLSLRLSHPGFRLFLKLTLPIMLALSLVFTDDWIMRWFGSYLVPASITWLSYAKTLMRVPLGVMGQAIGVAAFPFLAQLYSEGKFDELNRALTSTMKGLILLLVPISALTIAQSQPLVYFVFSYTRLQPTDLDATASTLAFFSLGMFAWGAQNILARAFYAARDTLTPAVIGTTVTLLSLPLYWLLVRQWQHLGLALASSVGIIAYMVVLFVFLSRRIPGADSGDLVLFLVKVSVASALAGLACYALARWLGMQVGWHGTLRALVVLVLASTAGFVLFGLLAKLLRVRELDAYLKRLR